MYNTSSNMYYTNSNMYYTNSNMYYTNSNMYYTNSNMYYLAGMDISPLDLINIERFAKKVVSLAEYRKELAEYLHNKMGSVCPNLCALIGDSVSVYCCCCSLLLFLIRDIFLFFLPFNVFLLVFR